ncbi:MAG: glycosyltransferase [Lachnospiraceae bacterium]
MEISNIVLSITNKFKPLLLKIFPYELLRKMKGRMIHNSFARIEKTEIKPFIRAQYQDGINLIGTIKAETGLGQSCRLVAAELEASQIPYSIYQYEQLGAMVNGEYPEYDDKIRTELPYNINLIHINPHELGLAFQQSHDKIWNGRYNIGFWLWELEEFPDEWVPCFSCLDEIWTPSEFISSSIRKKTDLPVVTIPYHISLQVPENPRLSYRKGFDLPEHKFLFLMMYDRTSMTERKNPKGVLEAYSRAFKSECDASSIGLVIKINNPTVDEIARIYEMIPEYHDIYLITETLERQKVNELIYCVDAVVSLHRAEGFGLVLAEAMFLGTLAIATDWSSNTEFMNSEVAYMVKSDLIELQEDIGDFKKGNRWANPDLDHAAECMKRLYEDDQRREELVREAKAYITEHLSMEQAVEQIRSRVKAIFKEN